MRAERVRHTPVLDEDGALCGIVSQRALFRGALAKVLGYGELAQKKLLATLFVKEVMATGVVATAPDAALADPARPMLDRKVGCLPVLDRGRLAGIVTEGDLVQLPAR